MIMSRLELEGKKFGRLNVNSFFGKDKFRRALWNCVCECGGKKIVASRELKSSAVISCGCLKNAGKFQIKHGKARTSEYHIWINMRLRCSSKCPQQIKKYYYDRGIKVCDEWNQSGGFDAFISHVGWKPSPLHSLDRIDNNGNYEPNNVRWATQSEQMKNTRVKKAIESFTDEEILAEIQRRKL